MIFDSPDDAIAETSRRLDRDVDTARAVDVVVEKMSTDVARERWVSTNATGD
jgi:hypothetical protein